MLDCNQSASDLRSNCIVMSIRSGVGSCEEDGIPECKHCNLSRHAVSCATFKASGGFCNVQGFPFTLAERGLPVQHRMLQVKAHVHHIC